MASTFSTGRRPPVRAAGPKRGATLALMAAFFFAAAAGAASEADFWGEAPLTQADIDAYTYLAPRLLGDIMKYPDLAAKLLDDVKMTRQRAIYITAKIPLAQALARGLISPDRLADARVPASLRPTTEEVRLVNANLHTLMQAEGEAIDFSGVLVPRKWRKAPPP